jgi:phenylalanyl-tRNA synthetase alpha chain
MNEQIHAIMQTFKDALEFSITTQALEQIRIDFLGRNGTITLLLKQLKDLPVEEKKLFGPQLQKLKQTAEQLYEEKLIHLQKCSQENAQHAQQYFDVTAYRYQPLRGHLHPYTHLMDTLNDIFISMGFTIVDGTEVETDYYNFETLNIPDNHPARDSHDTFWLNVPGLLMRTHTSSVQAHAMQEQGAPLAIVAPGRVYRNEATDASHDFMFTQMEGLLVDKKVSMAQLLATARAFLQKIFNTEQLNLRVRPGYFPFVEPGVEIDASCPFCTTGCSICKKTGWIELLGAGLVHPKVLSKSGIDPAHYSGFAFGFGIERIAMIKYGINDIRLFHSNHTTFLDQF